MYIDRSLNKLQTPLRDESIRHLCKPVTMHNQAFNHRTKSNKPSSANNDPMP